MVLWLRFNCAVNLFGAGLFIHTDAYALLFSTALLEFCLTRLLTTVAAAGDVVGLLTFLATDAADDEACCLVVFFGATLAV